MKLPPGPLNDPNDRTNLEPAIRAPGPRVRLIFGALMLVVLLASLDQTIVSTALPQSGRGFNL